MRYSKDESMFKNLTEYVKDTLKIYIVNALCVIKGFYRTSILTLQKI